MTSRDSQTPPSKLLPGVSARTWRRILIGGWIAGGVVFLIAYLVEIVDPVSDNFRTIVFPLLGVALILVLVPQLVLRYALPMEKAETRAGYTTLGRRHPELEQLDPKTGLVIRAAGQPYLRRGWGARLSPEQQALEVPRPGLARRFMPLVLWTAAGAVFFVAVYIFVGHFGAAQIGDIFLIMGAILGLYVIAALIGSLGMRRRLIRLQEAAPSEFVFLFRTSAGIVAALQALVPVTELAPAELTRARQVTASTTGLSFCFGNPLKRVGFLPWSRVTAVQYDTVRFGRGTNPSISVTFRDDDAGELVTMPLMSPEANYVSIASVAETKWIVSELNLLRTSTTRARVL